MEPPNFLCSAPSRVAEVHGFECHRCDQSFSAAYRFRPCEEFQNRMMFHILLSYSTDDFYNVKNITNGSIQTAATYNYITSYVNEVCVCMSRTVNANLLINIKR